jgi:hypothetical protein
MYRLGLYENAGRGALAFNAQITGIRSNLLHDAPYGQIVDRSRDLQRPRRLA